MLGLEGEKAMMVSYWFTAHILLAVPTFIFLTIVYLTKLGASKVVLAICFILGLANIFIGYRYISMVDAACGDAGYVFWSGLRPARPMISC